MISRADEGEYHFNAARDVTVFRIRLKSCRVGIDKNIALAKKKREKEAERKKVAYKKPIYSQVVPALHLTAGRGRCRAKRVSLTKRMWPIFVPRHFLSSSQELFLNPRRVHNN